MASEVTVCNNALVNYLGLNPIQSLEEARKEAKACKRIYAEERDSVLRSHKWGFATMTKTLALLTDTYPGWDYAYQMPTDCLVAREILDTEASGSLRDLTDTTIKIPKIPFEKRAAASGTGVVILTNQEDAVLLYTARITDVNSFDAQFMETLSLKIASRLAYPLRKDRTEAKSLFNQYLVALGGAQAVDSNEEEKPDNDYGSFVSARQ